MRLSHDRERLENVGGAFRAATGPFHWVPGSSLGTAPPTFKARGEDKAWAVEDATIVPLTKGIERFKEGQSLFGIRVSRLT